MPSVPYKKFLRTNIVNNNNRVLLSYIIANNKHTTFVYGSLVGNMRTSTLQVYKSTPHASCTLPVTSNGPPKRTLQEYNGFKSWLTRLGGGYRPSSPQLMRPLFLYLYFYLCRLPTTNIDPLQNEYTTTPPNLNSKLRINS